MQNRIIRSVVEALEGRRLLSAGPSPVSLNGSGQLRIKGTNGPDVIVVSLDATDSTKFIIPMEFANLLSGLTGLTGKSFNGDGAGQGKASPAGETTAS